MNQVLDTDDPLSSQPSITVQQQQQKQQQQQPVIPSLEELVDACCLMTILNTQQEQTQFTEPLTPINFQNYILKSHCEENLQFLIQIYKYEFIWNQLFKRRSSILKCKKQISNTASIQKSLKLPAMQRTNTNTSSIHTTSRLPTTTTTKIFIDKIDLKTGVDEDISTFVNLKLNNKDGTDKPDSWNDFDHQIINSDDDIDDHDHHIDDEDGQCLICTEEIKEDADPKIRDDLVLQWNNIISNYITNYSPSQINLPSEIYQKILEESHSHEILYHSPEILIGAKNFVLQLLRENIYEEFLDFYDSKPAQSLKPSKSIDIASLKTQFEKYEQHSTTTSSLASSTNSSSDTRPKVKKLHTVANIIPLVRGHTVHSFNNNNNNNNNNSNVEINTSTRGPCNVRVSEYSLYNNDDNHAGCKGKCVVVAHDEEHHKKGWVRKLLKHH